MALYPVDCTGDVVVGDTIIFNECVYTGAYPDMRYRGDRTIQATVISDSYGEKKQQHTFTLRIVHCEGFQAISEGTIIHRKGRNVYRYGTRRQLWRDEDKRKAALEEKHNRGTQARAQREARQAQSALTNG